MTTLAPALTGPSLAKLALALALPFAAGLLGQIATFPQLAIWYAGLIKPFFNPPNWLFGPVWSFLYALMGVAFWRILRAPADHPGRGVAIGWFIAQLVFNTAWSFAFFGARNPGLAILVVIGMLITIVGTMRAFTRVDPPSGWALAPLLAWVSFAAVLNVAIWWLNR